jgi:hypothetical protein
MEFEKLGAFYLGAEHAEGEDLDQLVMYDARDLTTHAVCIGMTGSGKTGLCLDLLEEAALDRVPALIIDPKGDITNLLLTFPDLRPEDFQPWVNVDDARRKGMEVEEFAAAQADLWRKGLGKWGQSGERIRALRETTDFSIYTPGSDAGIPVSVMSSFAAPEGDWEGDAEYLRERVAGTVSGILGLIGVDADPVQSREHILLANIFEHHWKAGRDLDLATLILAIQDPPVRRLGVFDVDTFFPQKDRMALAMQLNNLIAAPGFQSWLEGQPLDIPAFLSTPDGRPRHSIFYIAHLSDAERMFFVTMLLNQVITWMRAQPGTTSLRALLYMDEIFGFLPPVAEPPSKRPFLTLFKQARAYGLGVVLTTQNPVDLDYKALTNAGTWFIGRLQTERDKMRVLEGLEVAAADAGQALGRGELDTLISGLDKRVFLLHNVHEDAPITFRTRWAMSYLRGPLTRDQVADLMEGRDPEAPGTAAATPTVLRDTASTGEPAAPSATTVAGRTGRAMPAGEGDEGDADLPATPPAVAPGLRQVYLPLGVGRTAAALEIENRLGAGAVIESSDIVYSPGLLGVGSVHFLHKRSGAAMTEEFALLARPDAQDLIRWDAADAVGPPSGEWEESPEQSDARFAFLPEGMNQENEVKAAAKDLADHLYRARRVTLYHSPDVDEYSQPGETPQEFRLRLTQAAREKRDAEVDKIEDRYEKQLTRLGERLRRAQAMLDKREAEASARKRETLVSIGESVVGMFLGRRSTRTASSSLRRMRMSSSAKMRAEEAEENVEALQAEVQAMNEKLAQEVAEITAKWDQAALEFEEVAVTPRRADVDISYVAIGWVPHWRSTVRAPDGRVTVEMSRAF